MTTRYPSIVLLLVLVAPTAVVVVLFFSEGTAGAATGTDEGDTREEILHKMDAVAVAGLDFELVLEAGESVEFDHGPFVNGSTPEEREPLSWTEEITAVTGEVVVTVDPTGVFIFDGGATGSVRSVHTFSEPVHISSPSVVSGIPTNSRIVLDGVSRAASSQFSVPPSQAFSQLVFEASGRGIVFAGQGKGGIEVYRFLDDVEAAETPADSVTGGVIGGVAVIEVAGEDFADWSGMAEALTIGLGAVALLFASYRVAFSAGRKGLERLTWDL